MKFKIIIIIMLLSSEILYAFEMKDIAAYPVPFNPKKITLKIGYPVGMAVPSGYSINVIVFDINGDLVVKKTGAQMPVVWNGRNGSGRYVKPGLYILKVEIESIDGDYGKKIIRILVDY